MKYLAFIPGEYYGGCEEYAMRIVNAAIQRGWSVHLLVASAAVLEKATTALPTLNISMLRSPFGPDFNGPRSLKVYSQLASLKREYKNILAELKPSVIHAVLPWHYHSIFFLETCCNLSFPVLATYQLVAPNRVPHWRQKRIIKRLCKSNLLTLSAVSQNNGRLLASYYDIDHSDIPVIPNRPSQSSVAIDRTSAQAFAARHQLLVDLEIPKNSILSLTVASLHYQKGIDLLLKAASFLKEFDNLYFLIAGEGVERKNLEAFSKSLNVYKNVRFLGRRNDVDTLLSFSDFFLFPTRYEGGESFALLEAARSCLPIVASNASGIPETFRDNIEALLCEVEDPIALSKQVVRLLNNPNLAKILTRNALRRVSIFSESDMINETLNLLEHKALNYKPQPARP